MIENQFDKTIKIFQCDVGGEFTNKSFLDHLAQCGIIQHISYPNTPKQNKVAERKHHHIVETGLIMLIHANMPSRYWVESFSTATYLINKLPTPTLNLDIPFNWLFDKSPDYSFLRVFGCQCLPYLRNYTSDKLQPRSTSQRLSLFASTNTESIYISSYCI